MDDAEQCGRPLLGEQLRPGCGAYKQWNAAGEQTAFLLANGGIVAVTSEEVSETQVRCHVEMSVRFDGGHVVCRDSGSTVCSSSNSTLTRFANSRLGTQTTDGADNFTGSCGGAEASDVGRQFTVLDDGRYEFSVENATFDAIVYILEGNDCTGPERGCGKRVQVPLRNGDRVVAVLDGANGLCGSVTLRARFLEPL
jgi:hypothetical protein